MLDIPCYSMPHTHIEVGDLADYVEVKSTTRETEYKNSKEYGVRTKYIRTVCCASLKKDRRSAARSQKGAEEQEATSCESSKAVLQ
eukprot:3743241-Amphidinium_carterae.1